MEWMISESITHSHGQIIIHREDEKIRHKYSTKALLQTRFDEKSLKTRVKLKKSKCRGFGRRASFLALAPNGLSTSIISVNDTN